MGGGGGGGNTTVDMRQPSQEKKTIGNWYDFQQNQLGNFVGGQPLLNAAQTGSLDFWNQLPQLIGELNTDQGQISGFSNELAGTKSNLGDYESQLGGYIPQIGALSKQIGGYIPELQSLYSQLGGDKTQLSSDFSKYSNQIGGYNQKLGGEYDQLGSFLGQVLPTIDNHGKLSGEALRDVNQQTLGNASAAGSAFMPGTLGQEAVNAQRESDTRFNTALSQGQGLLGQQQGILGQQAQNTGVQAGLSQTEAELMAALTGQQTGIVNQQTGIGALQSQLLGQQTGIIGQQTGIESLISGLTQGQAALTGQNAGLTEAKQGLQTGGLNQLLGTENAEVGNFTTLQNPVLDYLSRLFGGNQNASIAQAQINSQQNQATQGAKGSTIGGGISAIGSIAGPLIAL